MNPNTKYLLLVLFSMCQSLLFAHNPQQSTIRLTIQENNALLDLSLAQYGVEQALIKSNPDLDLSLIEQNEFKELLIAYLKENILISINGKAIKIGSGIIKLGNHNTELKFIIENVPEKINYIDVDASCFKENEKQINFFKVAYNHLGARAKLSSKNDFKSKFIFTEKEISVIEEDEKNNTKYIWILGACLFLIILFLILKSRNG